jgi:hypothetical protein
MGNAILRRSKRACALCNALGAHDYNIVNSYEGSCIKEAYEDVSCSRCGDSFTQWYGTNPDNHEGPEIDGEVTPATCATPGNREVICDACDVKIRDEELPLDPDNHPENDVEINYLGTATCVTSAERYWTCSACNTEFGRERYYDENNHEGPILDNTQDEGKAPTCISEGYVNHWCEACNETWDETLEIDPNNHAGPVNTDSAPSTCVTHGYDSWYCEACKRGDSEELPLDPNNHEGPIGYSGDGMPSTCVTHGDREVHCDACGDYWGEELPLDPNNHEAWVDGGYCIEGHCEACGAVCEHEFYTDSEGYGRCSKCGYWDY